MFRAAERPLRKRLLVVAFAALALRLAFLGRRVVHWDEARLGLRILDYAHTGVYRYDALFHGPVLFHADRVAFSFLGPSAVSLRLPVAVVGGLLPLAAWLYRDHLDDGEVLALACLLAVDPVFVHYSRFARSDLLVAAFAFTTFGFLLRFRATGRTRDALGAGVAFGLACASKENAVLYLASWVGAVGLLALVAWRRGDRTPSRDAATVVRAVRTRTPALAAAALAFLAVVVALYAPRGPGPVTAGGALADPSRLPAVLAAATVTPARSLVARWVVGNSLSHHSPLVFFGLLAGVLLAASTVTVALAVSGARDTARPLVRVTVVWAALSLVGYPFATDIASAWIALHVLVPLTVPAAVGAAALHRRAARPSSHSPVVLGLAVAGLLLTTALTSYVAPGAQYNPVAQPSQLPTSARPPLERIHAGSVDGADVAYVGAYWSVPRHRLPVSWYVRRSGATAVRVDTVGALGTDPPPVVVTHAHRVPALTAAHPGYDCSVFHRAPWAGGRPAGLPHDLALCESSRHRNDLLSDRPHTR